MTRQNYIFTSECVSEGHPDKVCDRISDAVLDAFLRPRARGARRLRDLRDHQPRGDRRRGRPVATRPAERASGPVEAIARDCIRDIGYEQDEFHHATCEVDELLHRQSAHIAQGVDAARRQGRGRGRPGHHVRLCRRRDARADAGADPLRPRHPAAPGRGAQVRAPSRRCAPTPRRQLTLRYEDGQPRRGDADRAQPPSTPTRPRPAPTSAPSSSPTSARCCRRAG